MKTIGIVGGFTWLATLEYYRLINAGTAARLGGRHSARIVLESVDFEAHLRLHDREGWDGVAVEIAAIGRRLRDAGADFLLLTANTLHKVADPVEAAVGLPVLHIADATAAAVKARGLRRIGLLGTRWTMSEEFWRGRLAERHGIEVLIPEPPLAQAVDRLIYDELAAGRFEAPGKKLCLDAVAQLTAAGAEGIALGCTELPLLIKPEDTPAPLFDTLELHARAAVDLALAADE